MTCHPEIHLERLRRSAGTGALALLTTVCFGACQRSTDADVEPGRSVLTPAMADTPVTREQPAGENSVGGDAAGGVAPGADTAGRGAAQTAAPAGGGDVYEGWKMYAVNCERCHGQDALGSALAPDPRKSAAQLGHDGFVQVVVNGRPDKGMPAFEGVLEPQQIENILAYVQARASGALGPGRPQR